MNPSKIILAVLGVALAVVLLMASYQFAINQGTKTATQRVVLSNYKQGDVSLRLTTIGPVTANEAHQAKVITVGAQSRDFQIYQTYENQVAASQTYVNNQAAFADFATALEKANLTKGSERKAVTGDEAGVCATGQTYVYEVIAGAKTVMRLWSTSCGAGGTFKGDGALIRQLFQGQIPDYNKMVQAAANNH